jgi:DNA-binding transcriptional LysR family regulator
MLDTRQLRAFVAIAEELHFGRAADRLDVAQSALSRQLQELEASLGLRLLNRGRRAAVTLTEAGQALLTEARVALQQLERAEAAARRAGRGEVGRLEIGYVASAVLSGVLPRILGRFRLARPDVQVQLTAMETPRQLAALADGLLDLAFVRPRGHYPDGVAATVVHREDMLLAVAADHPLARRRIDLAALAKESFIIPQFDESAGFAEHLAALAARGGFEPKLTHRVRDFVTAIALAAAGYGVVPVPRSVTSIALENVVFRPIHGYEGVAELALAHRVASTSAATRAFHAVASDLRPRDLARSPPDTGRD